MPGAQGWYDSAKGIQESARGVTQGAVDHVTGVENVVHTAIDPVRQAIQGGVDDADLFA